MDFTLTIYRNLLNALQRHGRYALRHDVDKRPTYALRLARIEAGMGLTATYYFRAADIDRSPDTIHAISDLGHTIGYHYEELATCRGDMERAYDLFVLNLGRLRAIVPVGTACAHGSPRSPWNSQDIWKQHDIHALGISYEPMLDTDFGHTLYLTDTGRRWDGHRVSIRDKVDAQQEQWAAEGLVFHSTDDIIHAISDMQHPIHRHDLLVNTHPQRWMPFGAGWVAECLGQRAKNIVKRAIQRPR